MKYRLVQGTCFVASLLLLFLPGKASALSGNDPGLASAAQQNNSGPDNSNPDNSNPAKSNIVPSSAAQPAGADSAAGAASTGDPTAQPQQQSQPPQSEQPQQAPSQAQPQQHEPANAEQKNEDYERQTGTSKDRLGFFLPNFLSIDDVGKVPRLTWQQKFKAQARSSFDWSKIPWYTLLAGISQATNSDAALGQGGLGYAKRLGTIAADNTIENFFGSAILPSLLHQDPRFYVLDQGNALQRALYPVRHIFVTQGDSGNRQFNLSEIFGAGIAAAISTYAYHPHSERTLGDVGQVWYTEIAYDTVSLEAKEFWPLLRRRIKKDKNQNQALLGLQPPDQ